MVIVTQRKFLKNVGALFSSLLFALTFMWGLGLYLSSAQIAQAAGSLSVRIVAGYNLVVDSNVESPSTYAPSVATVMGEFCNDGNAPLTNVQGYIGDFTAATPGLYPTRDSDTDAAFQAASPHLANTGAYAFTHVGGRIGLNDATRFMGTLAAGECRVQYWHFTYPRRANPNNSGVPVWGQTNVVEDDLWLEFDIWGSSQEGSTADATWKMTMRNEISAMANKIQPNPNGYWFNTDTSIVKPGEVITSNGILYELGNINQGFDNNGDYSPDYNAWLQPIGDPSYDPSCFRLIGTSGTITVSRSGGNPDTIIDFENQLYFTDLPSDNTGVVGIVRYAFLALDGPCSTALTPYQEVASGYDNEKFNGDFGAGIPPVGSSEAAVTIVKNADGTVALGGTVTYNIPLVNGGTADAGLPLSTGGPSLVVSDTIPAGMVYVAGSAAADVPVTIRYYDGINWLLTEPAAATVQAIQWMLNDPLAANGGSANATFQAMVPVAYSGSSFIENEACASFGNGVSFACDDALTIVQGSNVIGNYVWADEDFDGVQDGSEVGIDGITVDLYWDRNGDGLLDDADMLLDSAETAGGGLYTFTNLANGNYMVVVDGSDSDLPQGYNHTTLKEIAVTGLGSTTTSPSNSADFGFGPILGITKSLVSGSPAYEGQEITYEIRVANNRPGNGSGVPAACQYNIWAATSTPTGPANSQWQNENDMEGAPDSLFATTVMSDNQDEVNLGGFFAGNPGDTMQSVKLVAYVKELTQLKDTDALEITLSRGATVVTGFPRTYTGLSFFNDPVGTVYKVEIDLSALGYTWANFSATSANPFTALVVGNPGGGAGASGDLAVDAVGFEITTNSTCGGADDTLNPVPVVDTYDADKLQFISSDPPVSTSSVSGTTPYANTGTLTWGNVGPLYAGGEKVITVVFKGLEPAVATPLTNTATITQATYLNGRPANEAQDDAVSTLNPAGSIGNYIWNDSNSSGYPAGGYELPNSEPGLPNVDVRISANVNLTYNGVVYRAGETIATVTTDATGYYLFEGLPDATYTVVVDTSSIAGMTQTADPNGTGVCGGGNPCDNTRNVTISGANDVTTADFGYTIPTAIFGTIWADYDADETIGMDENGIEGVTVQIAGPGCAVCTTVTDENGFYVFENLSGGNYTITVTPPGTQTADPDATQDNQHTVTTTAGINGPFNFGYNGPYNIGDTIFVDWDGDGVQDTGEEGLPNVTIYLYSDSNGNGVVDSEDARLDTQITAASGVYTFTNYPNGKYTVAVETAAIPAGYASTADPDGIFDGKTTVTVSGTSIDTIDFGYQPQGGGSIGDFVWQDSDRDGIQDAGESGLDAVTVTLYEDSDNNGTIDANDAVVATTQTVNGSYIFADLAAGNYLVDVDTADTDLPGDGNGNPYVLSSHNDPHDVALGSNQAYKTADFGFAAGATVGDYIWQDNDGDGIQDIGEPPLANVQLQLCLGAVCQTTTTDSNGLYEFSGLPEGEYTLTILFGIPAASIQTGDPDSTTPCGGVPAICDGGSTFALTPGQIDRSRDFGYQPAIVIGDYVWLDQNGNGVQDAGEVGIGGVTVELTLQGGTVLSTVTDSDGYYTFGAVPTGQNHTIAVDMATLPAGVVATYDHDGGGDSSAAVNIVAANLTFDFGYRYSGIYLIAGTVYQDVDQSGGDATGGEPTYPSVNVYLWRGSRRIAQTVTNISGNFNFPNLPPGNYTVAVENSSPALQGDTLTTNGNQNTGIAYESAPIVNANVLNVDFGYFGLIAPTAVTFSHMATAAEARTWIWPVFALLLTLSSIVTLRCKGYRVR